MPFAHGKGIAQGLAQRNDMPQQTQGAQHILIADTQAQTLLRHDLEGPLDHRHGLAVGNAQRRVVQVRQGEPQATAKMLGIGALFRHNLPQGLQEKGRDQGQFVMWINGFAVHGSAIPDCMPGYCFRNILTIIGACKARRTLNERCPAKPPYVAANTLPTRAPRAYLYGPGPGGGRPSNNNNEP